MRRSTPSDSKTPTYVTLQDASAQLGLNERTLRRRIAAGDLNAYKIGRSRAIRLRQADVDALMRPVNVAG